MWFPVFPKKYVPIWLAVFPIEKAIAGRLYFNFTQIAFKSKKIIPEINID